MKTRITYWKESDGRYLGYLNSHPEHWTQGESLEDLRLHLRDLFDTFSAEDISRHPQRRRARNRVERRDLIEKLESAGCVLLLHGGKHDIFHNPASGRSQPVPRHREINELLAKKILRDWVHPT